jgi:hypothetical protein
LHSGLGIITMLEDEQLRLALTLAGNVGQDFVFHWSTHHTLQQCA